jgi:V/A-type H+-transporting ATPase subunit I
MQKVMIAAHRSQAGQLISALQDAGIVQILDAERAMVSKEWPELEVEIKRPKEMEELVGRLDKAVVFLKQHMKSKDGRSVFQPLIEIDKKTYTDIVLGSSALILLEKAEQTQSAIEKLNSRAEALHQEIQKLSAWKELQTPVEQLGQLSSTVCLAGILPKQHFDAAVEAVSEIGAAVQVVGGTVTAQPCLVFGMKESAPDIQKTLRSFEFEAAGFEGIKGTVVENLSQRQNELAEIDAKLKEMFKTAGQLAGEKLKLEILADHYHNFLVRKQTQATAPATETTLFLESWVRKKDYPRLIKIVESFDGANAVSIEPAEGEEIPVEIQNASMIRPFESITRLYGMPIPSSVDPTVFLAPFFAIFFGLCVADAGYGLILIALLAWAIKKAQGDKKILWMLLICSITTFLAGVITGSWFGDAITSLLPANSGAQTALDGIRQKIMLFDPMTQPMTFFLLSLALGYFQIQCGLFIAFFTNLVKKDWAAAIWDQLTWIIHLNSLVCLLLAKGGILPGGLAKPCGIIAIITSLNILLFTVRSGGWGGRFGLGFYQLFSTVFYMGDTLSYARLMALGMVGSGFGMAVNVLVKLFAEIPYVGWLIAAFVFVALHLFNIAMSLLGAFVHTMRLQFVEFFPKFFIGGGRDFVPLRKEFKHVQIKE